MELPVTPMTLTVWGSTRSTFCWWVLPRPCPFPCTLGPLNGHVVHPQGKPTDSKGFDIGQVEQMLTCGAEAKQSGPKDIHRHSQQEAGPPAVEAEQAGPRTRKPKPKKLEDTEAPRPKAAQTKTDLQASNDADLVSPCGMYRLVRTRSPLSPCSSCLCRARTPPSPSIFRPTRGWSSHPTSPSSFARSAPNRSVKSKGASPRTWSCRSTASPRTALGGGAGVGPGIRSRTRPSSSSSLPKDRSSCRPDICRIRNNASGLCA